MSISITQVPKQKVRDEHGDILRSSVKQLFRENWLQILLALARAAITCSSLGTLRRRGPSQAGLIVILVPRSGTN